MVQAEYTGIQNLYAVINYCLDQSRCRRYMVAQHFGEVWRVEDCKNMCDICVRNTNCTEEDVTLICEGFLEILDSAQAKNQKLTAAKLIDSWKNSNIAKQSFKKKLTVKKLEIILAHCLIKGVLRVFYNYTPYTTISYIIAGERAHAVKSKRLSVKVLFPDSTCTSDVMDIHVVCEGNTATTASPLVRGTTVDQSNKGITITLLYFCQVNS